MLFHIPSGGSWDVGLHNMSYDCMAQQTTLPLRLGGMGLRSARRTSHAAYWASWADVLPELIQRFPDTGNQILHRLTDIETTPPYGEMAGIRCLRNAEQGGRLSVAAGWQDRPNWRDLATGTGPPITNPTDVSLGEHKHGWQYHATAPLERAAHTQLLQDFLPPGARRNAISPNKARVYSCMGPFASIWLLVCPTTVGLTISNDLLQCAVRRRLGVACSFEGPDSHGHSRLADGTNSRLYTRHTEMVGAWRQIFQEAGGKVPDRNIERMLARTNIPVPTGDLRRLDIIVPGLNIDNGLPLFCDVTVISPISRNGAPRSGTSSKGGTLLEQAEHKNNNDYHEVLDTGLGSLLCLGAEVYGRWGAQCTRIVPELARERTRGLHGRVRQGILLSLQHRWWGILGIALQSSVARAVLREVADLPETRLEPVPPVTDLEIV